jgi:hypothetical protein
MEMLLFETGTFISEAGMFLLKAGMLLFQIRTVAMPS